MHRGADEPGRDDPGPEVVSAFARPARERELLLEPLPVDGDEHGPQVVGIPPQGVAGAGQRAVAVGEDGSGGDLQHGLSGHR